MKYQTLTYILCYWFFILPIAGAWDYEKIGIWPEMYPQCGGSQQSPIALYSQNSSSHPVLYNLQFYNYKKPLAAPVKISNNGHSAEIHVIINNDGTFPFLTIGGSTSWYEAQAVHFHWGSEGVLGSEHSIDDERYDLEMHIVHKNFKYPTFNDALQQSDGIVVLGVLFKADETRTDQIESHRTFDEICNALQSISQYNSSAELTGPITMNSFLPDLQRSPYFSYKGSTTTPPCAEAVQFFIFSDVLSISYDDLSKFWTLTDKHGGALINNFRPIQPSTNKVYLKRIPLILF